VSATATVKHLDPTQVELEIAIPQADLEAARERAFRDLAKNARIPGFRPGKVPRKIFEAQYGSAAIEERAMDAVVPDAYSKALQENDLEPLERPQMELLPVEDETGPLRLRATVAVRPQIVAHDYKGIAVTGPSVMVTDEDVEAALTQLSKDAGTLVPVDRPVALGDTPTIDYEGKIDGVPFDGGTAKNQATEILEDRFIPGFATGIVGMSAGETKDIETKFPDDYTNEELAGKTAIFTITVHDNKVSEPVTLDDELAVRFKGEGATLATLRDDLRNRLEANARDRRRRAVSGELLEKIIAAHDVPLPEIMVDREAESIENEAKSYIERAGLTWEDYLEKQGKAADDLRAEYRVDAERRVKTSLVLEAIAKAEHITATGDDIEAEVAQMSRQYGQPREAILQMLRENVNALIDQIVRTKTVEFLIDNAVITEPAKAAAASAEA
jgi:trigger factor